MRNEEFWTLITRVYPGLVPATCAKVNRRLKITSQVPEVFQCVEDLEAHAYIVLRERETLEAFDAEKANGIENFPGFIANRVEGILRNALQDANRKKSVSLQGWETPDMVSKGETFPLYSPATHCDLVAQSNETKSSRDDEAKDQSMMRGSVSNDWCARCNWDVMDQKSPEETQAFLENILWELSPEEAKVAQYLVRYGSVASAAGALKIETSKAHRALKSARARLQKLGVSTELMAKGHIV